MNRAFPSATIAARAALAVLLAVVARSRKEAPEEYESYVHLEPGVWTRYKIEVEGRRARLYVHGAEQPCLIVNDLKPEPRSASQLVSPKLAPVPLRRKAGAVQFGRRGTEAERSHFSVASFS